MLAYRGKRLLRGFDQEIGGRLGEEMAAKGVRIRFGAEPHRIGSRKGGFEVEYGDGDVFVFGSETAGLPDAILGEFAPGARLRLPMRPGNRSLNLSNAVAVVVFEAWRQLKFA